MEGEKKHPSLKSYYRDEVMRYRGDSREYHHRVKTLHHRPEKHKKIVS